MGIGTAIKNIWNSEVIEDYEEIIMINPALIQAWANIDNSTLIKEVKKGANSTKGGKSNSLKKYKTPEIEIVEEKTTSEKRSLDDMKKVLSKKTEPKIIKEDKEIGG